MNFLDFIFIALFLFAAWKGFKRGFVIELFTFLALFLGLYAGIHFSNFVSIFLRVVPSKLISRPTGYSAYLGTVESSTNHPDLYMTSEALDALSTSLQIMDEK